tara:strand:+ start:99 stop:548 length:450 start_codon:yes stop_codon:yes gene_type:complete
MNPIDEIGNKYGEWTVKSFSHSNPKSRKRMWNCVCSCGRTYVRAVSDFRTGHSTRCRPCSYKLNSSKINYKRSGKGMPVYFIRGGDYVKIGASVNPKERLKQLQVGNPMELELVNVDKKENEEWWHKVFAHRHHRGEWYLMPAAGGCEV